MAHIALTNNVTGPLGQTPGLRNPIARAWRAFGQTWREALREAAEERQALRRERALRHLDNAQMRDIGLDRGHC